MTPGAEVASVTRPEATLQQQGSGCWVLRGDLLFENSAQLLADGETAFGAEPRAEIDLSGVGRMDSAGLALLLEWSIAARDAGRVVIYSNPPAVLGALAGISDVSGLLAGAG